jgi:hypothetical protein
MTDDPEVARLKGRIEQTRSDLGETVQALAAKADVKARAGGAVRGALGGVKAKAQDAADGVKAKAQGLTAGAQDLAGGAKGKAAAVGTRARGAIGGGTDNTTAAELTAGAELTGPGAVPAVPGDTALAIPEEPGELPGRGGPDRRLQGILLATAVGAMLGAVIVWVRGRRR